MKTALKVGENTVWQLGSKATNAVTGLVIINIIQRLYGDTGVGIYSIIIAYISFFFMPVDFGLNAIAVKHLLDKTKKPHFVFRNLLGTRLLLTAILTTIAIALSLLLPHNLESNTGYSPQVKLGIMLVAGTILAQALLSTSNAFFQATEKYRSSFIANIVSALVNIVLFITILNLGAPIHLAIISLTISGIIGGITAMLIVKRSLRSITPLFDKKYIKGIAFESLPLTISLILNLIYFRIDSLILPLYRQIEEVGRYNVAYKIFDTILVIPNYFANALYPVLLQKYSENLQTFVKTIKKSALSLTALSLTGSLLSYFLAPVMVYVVTGTYNEQTTLFIRILTAGLFAFFLSSISMWSLIVIGKQKYLAYIYGTTMTINILANVIFIPTYGALASAYITIMTELLVLLLSGPLLLKEIKNKLKDSNETHHSH